MLCIPQKHFLETICGWRKNAPTPTQKKKKIHVLIPGICEYMTSHGKKVFADVTLKWKEHLDYPGKTSVNNKGP